MSTKNNKENINADYVQYKAELGEGIYFDHCKNTLYWIDINSSTLYRYDYIKCYRYVLKYKVSAVLEVENDQVYLSSEVGIVCYDFESREMNVISEMPENYAHDDYRSNDAIKLAKNLYMFGVMRNNPLKNDGVLVLSKNGHSKVIYRGIAIPNSFIKIPDANSLLISDSFEKVTYRFDFNRMWDKVLGKTVWLDLSDTGMTPDGGCISQDGRIFLAIWDGHKIIELNLAGEVVGEFHLPFPRPTSCALDETGSRLLVTSAYEGLSEDQLKAFPLSGTISEVNVE